MARFELRTARDLARFIAPKGSVTLDGVSLTVNTVDDLSFSVLIIPHTLNVTTLGGWRGQRGQPRSRPDGALRRAAVRNDVTAPLALPPAAPKTRSQTPSWRRGACAVSGRCSALLGNHEAQTISSSSEIRPNGRSSANPPAAWAVRSIPSMPQMPVSRVNSATALF